MSEVLPHLNWSKNEEESDSDFDDVDLEDVFKKAKEDKDNKGDLISRISELAKRLNFLGEVRQVTVSRSSSSLDANAKDGEVVPLGKSVKQLRREYEASALLASAEADNMYSEVSAIGLEVVALADSEYAAQLGVDDVDKHIEELAKKLAEKKKEVGPLSSISGSETMRSIVGNASDEQIAKALQLLKDKYGITEVSDNSRPPHKVSWHTQAEYLRDISTDISEARSLINATAVLPEKSPGESALMDLYRDFKSALGDDDAALLFRPSTGNTLIARGDGEDTTTEYKPMASLFHLASMALLLTDDPEISKNFKDKVETLNLKKKQSKELEEMRSQLLKVEKDRATHAAEFVLSYLGDAGMIFDTIDTREFSLSEKTETGRIVKESWKYLPKDLLLAIKDRMARTNRRVDFKLSRTRGHYNDRTTTVKFDSVSVALHEQGHMIEELIPTITYLEHAFLSRRIKEKLKRDKKVELQNSNYIKDGSLQEVSLSDVGVSFAYTAKFYPTYSKINPQGGEYAFGPSRFFEVFTTGLEDLFTKPGRYSEAGTQAVVVGKGANAEFISDAYKDPSTGFWYRDASKSERIYPSKVQGRTYSEGQDKELRGFILGTLMMLHDWS